MNLPQRGIPVLGRVSVDVGALADEILQDYLEDLKTALGIVGDDDYFIPAYDDSMRGVGIQEGDLVGIRPGGKPKDGEIVLAHIEGEEGEILKPARSTASLSYKLRSAPSSSESTILA